MEGRDSRKTWLVTVMKDMTGAILLVSRYSNNSDDSHMPPLALLLPQSSNMSGCTVREQKGIKDSIYIEASKGR
jgi:hypothetical protein